MDLFVTTQWLHVDRQQIAPCLGLPEEKVRITLAGLGGAFGSREDVHLQIHACMLALHTGRPVKFMYGRPESFFGHVHRHPSRIWARTGATRDGRLVSVQVRLADRRRRVRVVLPGGDRERLHVRRGPVRGAERCVEGTRVYTNNPPCGAMRGFGAPQACSRTRRRWTSSPWRSGWTLWSSGSATRSETGSVSPTGQVIRRRARRYAR